MPQARRCRASQPDNRSVRSAAMSASSISCNASNQDVVSMGTVAARKAFQSIRNAKHVLTVEVFADLQALSFRNSGRLGHGVRRVHDLLLPHFQVYDNGRVLHDDLARFRKLLFSSSWFDDLGPYLSSPQPVECPGVAEISRGLSELASDTPGKDAPPSRHPGRGARDGDRDGRED